MTSTNKVVDKIKKEHFTKGTISDILDTIVGSSGAPNETLGFIDDGVLVNYKAEAPSLGSSEWKYHQLERVLLMNKLKIKSMQHCEVNGALQQREKSFLLNRPTDTNENIRVPLKSNEIHTILKKDTGSKTNSDGIIQDQVQSKQSSISNVTWKEPVASTKLVPGPGKLSNKQNVTQGHIDKINKIIVEKAEILVPKSAFTKKASLKLQKKAISPMKAKRKPGADDPIQKTPSFPVAKKVSRELPGFTAHYNPTEINQRKLSSTLLKTKTLQSSRKKQVGLGKEKGMEKKSSTYRIAEPFLKKLSSNSLLSNNPFSKALRKETLQKSSFLLEAAGVAAKKRSKNKNNTNRKGGRSANAPENEKMLSSISSPAQNSQSPRNQKEGEVSSNKSMKKSNPDNNHTNRSTNHKQDQNKAKATVPSEKILSTTPAIGPSAKSPAVSAYFPNVEHHTSKKPKSTSSQTEKVPPRLFKELEDQRNANTENHHSSSQEQASPTKLPDTGKKIDSKSNSTSFSPTPLPSSKPPKPSSSKLELKGLDSLLARIKPPKLPEMEVCNVLPGTAEWQQYWMNFNKKMGDYYEQVEKHSRRLDSLLVDEDGLSYTQELRKRELEELTMRLCMGLPPKPPIIKQPLKDTVDIGGYVIRPLGGPVPGAYVTTHDHSAFRLEIQVEKIESELENINVDTKFNNMTITIPSMDKGNPFRKLIQITVPNHKKVQNLEVGHPLYNGGSIIITGK